MLFTRCPDCDTTFRVTDDALKRANGQVRCGRCASVFNAYAERRDEPGAPIANAPSQRSEADTPATGPHPVAAAAPVPAAATQPSAAAAPPLSAAAAQPSAPAAPPVSEAAAQPSAAAAPQPTPAEAAVPVELAKQDPPIRIVAPSAREEAPEALLDPDADLLAGLSVESVVAQLEQGTINGGADDSALLDLDAAQDAAIPPAQVEAVLETEPIGDWRHLPKEPARSSSSSSNYWGVGVAVTVAMLAVQLVNHYRAELVKFPSVGSLVQSAYAAVGVVVLPRWDVRQYQILDWVATAEPSSGGIGSLRITARIKNLGPEYQPYPDVNLRLKDRWEAAVGGRVFAPAEYLAATPRKLMAPGETARAQLELVDPGPDAYGFDLDVCVEIETHVLSCRNDKVFL